MAHPQVASSVPAKLSFAKIAAMPAPNVAPALPNIIRDPKSRPSAATPQNKKTGAQAGSIVEPSKLIHEEAKDPLEEFTSSMDTLALTENNLNGPHTAASKASEDSLADDQSQLSTSSLKHQSFDTKSMASVTTFAMDEKESIRPDDSASVRAVEEDDHHPGLSRNSSFRHETEPHATLSKSNVRMLGPSVTIAAKRYPYTTLTNPPRFGDLPLGPMPEPVVLQPRADTESSSSLTDEPRPRPPIVTIAPDQKLLEALASPKDRLPLLQLEEKIMAFISSSRDTMLELPPQNSFTRLLTYKLADYYNLAHHINDENNSVRVFRTEYCTLPVPLAELAKALPIGANQISHATQIKIISRAKLGARHFSAGNSTAASSSAPSKATSENGVETNSEEGIPSPAEGTPNKDRSKLSREQREAQYKAARERIFGDFQESVTSESGSTGEASASMSRSSSSSGKKKSRKHKTPRDDTFEARSSFIPSYAPIHMQPMYQQAYNELQYSSGYGSGTYSPNLYHPAAPSQFAQPDLAPAYNNQAGYNVCGGMIYGNHEGWHNQQQTPPGNMYNFQPPQSFQQQPLHPQMNNQYSPNSPSAMSQSPSWAANQFQNMYLQGSNNSSGANWQSFNNGTASNVMPYQYGQLPLATQAGSAPYANQHSLPNSFTSTKSLFNPQTRSFVPSNNSARGGGRGGRKRGQGTGSARTSGTNSPAVSNLSDSFPARPKEDSLQQKYGTPANLPKKPPPSQVSPHFNSDHTTNNTNAGPLVVNGNGKGSTP